MSAREFIRVLFTCRGSIMYCTNKRKIHVCDKVVIDAKKLGITELSLNGIIFKKSVVLKNFHEKRILIMNSLISGSLSLVNIIKSSLVFSDTRIGKLFSRKLRDCQTVTTNPTQEGQFTLANICVEVCAGQKRYDEVIYHGDGQYSLCA